MARMNRINLVTEKITNMLYVVGMLMIIEIGDVEVFWIQGSIG